MPSGASWVLTEGQGFTGNSPSGVMFLPTLGYFTSNSGPSGGGTIYNLRRTHHYYLVNSLLALIALGALIVAGG